MNAEAPGTAVSVGTAASTHAAASADAAVRTEKAAGAETTAGTDTTANRATAASAPATGFRPGDEFVFRWRKWDGGEHWSFPGVWLGEDEHGQWIGQHAGTESRRPGASFVAPTPYVTLVPSGLPWAATFCPPGHPERIEVYIDLAAEVVLTASEQTAIDMDLDVIRTADERGTWLDDEDEFAAHSAQMGYPRDVSELIEQTADELLARVEARQEPFDLAAGRWLAVLASFRPSP